MILQKVHYHIKANIEKFFYKLYFRNRLHIGHGATWRKRMHFFIDGGSVVIGDRCFFNHDCSINSLEKIDIGNDCLFGEGVKIYDHNHRFSDLSMSIKEQGFSKAVVTIGNDCWIGSNVTILKGASIGNHCVIAAGVTVDFEIPDNTIVKRNDKFEMVRINAE